MEKVPTNENPRNAAKRLLFPKALIIARRHSSPTSSISQREKENKYAMRKDKSLPTAPRASKKGETAVKRGEKFARHSKCRVERNSDHFRAALSPTSCIISKMGGAKVR